MSVDIGYKGKILATMNNKDSKKILTRGKYCEDDFSISYVPDLQNILLRLDAELIKTWSHDSLAVTDDEVTIPAYSTSAQTLITAENLTPTIDLDYTNYNYYVVEEFLTTPVYSTATAAKSRNEFGIGCVLYELMDIPADTFKAASGKKYASRAVGAAAATCYRLLYWSSASALGIYTASSYGVAQVATAPTISSGKWTIKAPTLQMRGSTSYLTSTVWGTITDIRRQYVIKVYRAPKGNFNLDAWGLNQLAAKIMDDVNNNNGTLKST